MRYVKGFFAFWYDFIVGDAWEVAVGVGTSLVVISAITDSGEAALRRSGWVFLALIIAVLLGQASGECGIVAQA
jgi:hypothetical protein